MPGFAHDLTVTLRALTRTTERGARRRGVGYFLPALFPDRFANMGGFDRSVFVEQLRACRSFGDEEWTTYWTSLAHRQLELADHALDELGGPPASSLLQAAVEIEALQALGAVLAPAVDVLSHRSRENAAGSVDRRRAEHPRQAAAAVAIDAIVKAVTYLFAASWPGWTPKRMEAYWASRHLFDALLRSLAPALEIDVEAIRLEVDGETVTGYAIFGQGPGPWPAVLSTNGLEGTIQELALPLLEHRHSGLATVLVEMPGTYAYRKPLSGASENVYTAVLDYMAAHPRIDGDRIGMVGVSFGAYWSTRMAARDRRIKAVVSNGGLYHRSFEPAATFGMPEIMLETLTSALGASGPLDLAKRLRDLSLEHRYADIAVPLLAINGAHDTLASTQDTVDLANGAPLGELLLYPDDDHCAMGHYDEWLARSVDWLRTHLQ